MATAYYSQPAAANYFTPPSGHHHAQKQRGYRLCDQCGAVENPAASKFRMCGGCMTTQYCSPDCQKSHWTSHKSICQHTAAQIAGAKQQPVGPDYADENVAKHLRKFTSNHATLLGWAGFQALQLKRLPANVRANALLVELEFTNHPDANRRLAVKGTHIVPRTYVTSRDPLVADDIARREERCRRAGGIGTAVILIQCGGVSQVMPVEVDPPSKISWDERNDWAEVMRHFVESGRTDFKPISSTARGTYYG
ncbi:hypothetical protein FIBSPDRAFT_830278 [Athelia psychrophila]|uniref:MYND-type domain-containing protein n=1 Tax=Athelia psychrophila TaxID=1759441 RepID=A0A166GCR3_9AGAM|nr:hypothetical protein FIBSPDRAFT_830278 [Fibularhizoctonia sp. CBS 109695]